MTWTPTLCGHNTTTPDGRVFTCVRPLHPDSPDEHYFIRRRSDDAQDGE